MRGASSFLDSSRWVLALFLCEEEEARQICLDQGLEYDRLRVVRSCIVKANSEADMIVKTLIRKGAFLELLSDETKNKLDMINYFCGKPRHHRKNLFSAMMG